MTSLRLLKKLITLFFENSITYKYGFVQVTILPGAYEFESLNNETEWIVSEESHRTGTENPFTVKPNFSTLGSIVEIFRQEPIISFTPNDSVRDF